MVQELIGLLASFFDVLSCKLIDGSVVHWLHSLMFFDVFRLIVQWAIDVLTSFFDVLLSIPNVFLYFDL